MSSYRGAKASRPCRNIGIYGYCKFADTTCLFNHDPAAQAPPPQAAMPGVGMAGPGFNAPGPGMARQPWSMGAPAGLAAGGAGMRMSMPPPAPAGPQLASTSVPFVPPGSAAGPRSATAGSGGLAANVASFVPSSAGSAPQRATSAAASLGLVTSGGISATTPSFVPKAAAAPFQPAAPRGASGGSGGRLTASAAPFGPGGMSGVTTGGVAGGDVASDSSVPVMQGGTMFFMTPGGAVGPGAPNPGLGWGVPMDTLLLEPVATPAPQRRTWKSRFLPDRLYDYYQHQSAWLLAQLPPEDARYKAIPPQYTRVFPLDVGEATGTTGSFGYVTSVYKVTSSNDGMTYALRRVDNVRAQAGVVQEVMHRWQRVAAAGVIPLRNAFVDHGALFFVHDFCPGAKSLRELFLDAPGPLLPESTLWSYVCQLVTMLRGVHAAGLACRCIDSTHVLVTGHNRVKFAAAGVIDVVEATSKTPVAELQRADVHKLGNLILSLACRNPAAPQQPNESMEFIASSYSAELRNLLFLLVSKPVPIVKVCSLIGPQLAHELDLTIDHAAALDASLARECENGRLLRIMIKLGLINERPEHKGDASWSETGDRYLLKLFRNFVFHQIDGKGMPVFDMGHILESLNKLDVGDDEQILLSSPDEQALLVASFDDVRQCLNTTYDELRSRKTPVTSSALSGVTGKKAGAGGVGVGPGGIAGGRGRGRGRGDGRSRLFTPQTAAQLGMGGMRGGAAFGRGGPGAGGMVYGMPPSGAYGMGGMQQMGQPPAGYPGMPGAPPPQAMMAGAAYGGRVDGGVYSGAGMGVGAGGAPANPYAGGPGAYHASSRG